MLHSWSKQFPNWWCNIVLTAYLFAFLISAVMYSYITFNVRRQTAHETVNIKQFTSVLYIWMNYLVCFFFQLQKNTTWFWGVIYSMSFIFDFLLFPKIQKSKVNIYLTFQNLIWYNLMCVKITKKLFKILEKSLMFITATLFWWGTFTWKIK